MYTTFLVCVDSYENNVLRGRICNPYRSMEYFESLSQFLVKMEALLDEQQFPQAYMHHRRFSAPSPLLDGYSPPLRPPKGLLATFRLQIRFRQNASWQGSLLWTERHILQSFRSVLELILLLDSALQETARKNPA